MRRYWGPIDTLNLMHEDVMELLGIPLSTPDAKRLRQLVIHMIVLIAVAAVLDRSGLMADGGAASFLASTTGCFMALAYGVSIDHGLRGLIVMWAFGIPTMALADLLRAVI